MACKPLSPTQDSRQMTVDSTPEATLEVLTSNQSTVLKRFMADSAVLSADERCPVPEGTILMADSIRHEGVNHWRVFNLRELKLPSGEVAQRVRTSNEFPVASSSLDVETEKKTDSPSEPALQSTPINQGELKNPAQLLNCVLLESDSFLVFSPHFSRQVKSEVSQSRGNEGDLEQGEGGGPSASVDFVWQWPTKGRTIRNDSGGSGYFNAPRASGRGHQGIDIVAAVGEPVMATRSGTIIDPNWEGSYGKVVDVRHEGDYLSRYAHLSSFTYSHGTYVQKGDRIAAAGRTGNASGYGITPHLHFEIRRSGRIMNPKALLP